MCPPLAIGTPTRVESGHCIPLFVCWTCERSRPVRNLTCKKPARRSCRETYFPAKQPQTSSQARFPCQEGDSRRPSGTAVPSGQGPPSSQCVIVSIARRRTFADLRRRGRRVRSGSVRLTFLPMQTVEPQVAFAIGRSFGNAVERNRGRRRLRAAFVEALGRRSLHPQGAFLLAGDRGLLTDRFPRLVEDVEVCLDKAGAATPGSKRAETEKVAAGVAPAQADGAIGRKPQP